MSAEVWTVVSAMVVILIAIATAHRAMRRDLNDRFREVNKRIDGLGERISAVQLEMSERFGEMNERAAALRTDMGERFAALRAEMGERFGEVNERIAALRTDMGERFGEVNERAAVLRGETNERLGRVEGLLEGVGYMRRKGTSKERSATEQGAAQPLA